MILGANDFIAKPYNTQVLLTHIQAVLKRSTKGHEQQTLTHGGIALNLGKSVARFKESEVELTKNELRILALLMRNRGMIVSRDELMNEIWQTDEFIDDNKVVQSS